MEIPPVEPTPEAPPPGLASSAVAATHSLTRSWLRHLRTLAPLPLLMACGGTGLLSENDIAHSGYCGIATAKSTTWPSNLSLTEGDGVVAFQAPVAQGKLHVDSNGSWLLKLFPHPDATFDSGLNFDATFDSENDVRDEIDENGMRTVTLKTVIPFEYKGDTYEKDATFVLESDDEGSTLRATMQESPIIDGKFGIDLVVADIPKSEPTDDTATQPPPPPSLLKVCEHQLTPEKVEGV